MYFTRIIWTKLFLLYECWMVAPKRWDKSTKNDFKFKTMAQNSCSELPVAALTEKIWFPFMLQDLCNALHFALSTSLPHILQFPNCRVHLKLIQQKLNHWWTFLSRSGTTFYNFLHATFRTVRSVNLFFFYYFRMQR